MKCIKSIQICEFISKSDNNYIGHILYIANKKEKTENSTNS